MSIYEMEIALLDNYVLSFVDLEDFTQCYLEYCGADTLLLTRTTEFGETQEFHDMPSLLVNLEGDDFKIIEKTV